MQSFVEKVYPPDRILIKERESLTSAYLLLEGKCRLVLMNQPSSTPLKLSSSKKSLNSDSNSNMLNLIFDSPSLNYSLGSLSPLIWIGEEICLDTPSLPYSVVTESAVKVLEIPRQVLVTMFPREFHDKV